MRVERKESLAQGVVRVTLSCADGSSVPAWQPGAHIDLTVDGDVTRQYSLCGDPADTSGLSVAVLREADGRGGSVYVHDHLEPGDVIEVGGPRNHFELVDAPSYLFVAGGIGITPIIPMMRAAQQRGAEWKLLYGGRSRDSMAFVEELDDLYPGLVAARPQDEFGLLDLAAAVDATPTGSAVYCCGPEPLLSAIEDVCQDLDVSLHVERFAPKALGDLVDDTFDVELSKSGRTITVGGDESILDALLRNDVDIDFSCREGTCGTCEVAVCGGTPEHRDSVLSADEQEANDAMMVCVSRSRTTRLIIDL
ncbi:oxidoreductase [Streptomyces sp. SID6673]|nr:oxidoreductase [Streptomyces sp. SID11726]NEB23957.1 oxidoreductase [Streptomyces sp. SID6673]